MRIIIIILCLFLIAQVPVVKYQLQRGYNAVNKFLDQLNEKDLMGNKYRGQAAPLQDPQSAPDAQVVVCETDIKLCLDGKTLSREPPACEFLKCPEEQ